MTNAAAIDRETRLKLGLRQPGRVWNELGEAFVVLIDP